MPLESLVKLKVLLLLLRDLVNQFYIINKVLMISYLSKGFLLSVMMGSSAAISSTSSSTSVLYIRPNILWRQVQQVDGFGFDLSIATHILEENARGIITNEELL